MTAPLSIPPVAQGESSSPAAFLFGFLGPVRLRRAAWSRQIPAAFSFSWPGAPRAGFARGGRVYPAPSFGVRRPCRRFSVRPKGGRYPILKTCPESRRVPHRSRFLPARPAGGQRLGSSDPTPQRFSSHHHERRERPFFFTRHSSLACPEQGRRVTSHLFPAIAVHPFRPRRTPCL